jgi:Tol biopolymer transport system component
MERPVSIVTRDGGPGKTDRGGRRPAAVAVLVLASLILFLAPPGSSQVLRLPNVYLRHCAAGPPFGSTTNEAAMTRLFGVVEEGWQSLCIENLSTEDVDSIFNPDGATFVFLDGSDRTATELAAFLAANRTVIETWVSDSGGKLFLNAGPSEGGNIDFGFGGVTLVFDPGSGTPSQGGRAVEPTHPIFNGPFLPVGTQFTSDPNATFFAQGFIRDDMGRGDPPLAPPLLTTVIQQADGLGNPLGRAALAELTFGFGLVAFGAMTTDDLHLPGTEAANLRANILAHVNRGGTNVEELTGGGPGGTRWIVANDGGTSNRQPIDGVCDASGGLRVADGILGNQADAFDDGLTIWINDRIFVAPGSVRLGESASGFGSYTAGPVALTDPSVAGLKVTVEHVAAQGSATLRTVVRFQNPTAGQKDFTVDLVSNSGADGGFTVEATDSGVVPPPDSSRWIVVSDASLPDGDVVVTHVLRGAGAPLVTPSLVDTTVFDCGGTQGIKVRFDLSVPPGQTRALLFFTQLAPTPAAAVAAVQSVFPDTAANPVTDGELLIGLTPAEIVNWQGLTTPSFTLTVTTTGSGTGTVSSVPAGISCGADCTETYPSGTTVMLVPVADEGSVFAGFGGDCGLGGICTLSTNRAVTATFVRPEPGPPGVTLPLQVRKVGTGDGTVFGFASQASITCGLDCAEAYPGGTVVTLLAVPVAGSIFAGFGGDPDCIDGSVTMNGSRFCTAAFFPVQPGVVSVDTGGGLGNGDSQNAVMSADGRFVAFDSAASNLVAGVCAQGGLRQVFVRDRATGVTECVSVADSGQPGDLSSSRPSVSADGQFVAFESTATNLAGPCTGGRQVFVRDRTAGTTTCVSVSPVGTAGNAPSGEAAVSGDGAIVAFQSNATNLMAGVCASGVSQVFVRDRAAGVTTCASLGPGGAAGDLASSRPSLNADGSVVVFESSATNLVAAGCTAGGFQIFLRDRTRGATECVSVGAGGAAGNGASMDAAVSEDGRVVAFVSTATNLAAPCTTGVPQVFVRNRTTAATTCASVAPDGTAGDATSFDPAISGDGRFVAFASLAGNLAGSGGAGGTAARILAQAGSFAQVLRRHMGVQSSVAELVSQSGGAGGNGPSVRPALDRTGGVTAFQSQATNLRPGGSAGRDDVLAATLPGVPDVPAPPADRPIITAPAGGSLFPLAAPTPVTFTWTAVAGAASYGFEFTGPNLQFANPNAGLPDGVNGFGGLGGGFLFPDPGFATTLDPSFPPGIYQIRVIGLDAGGSPVGTFSDAVTLFLGLLPPTARPTITAPASGTPLAPGALLTVTWTETAPGVPRYLFEFTGPDLSFTNPNAPANDPVNGFGGLGGGGLVTGTTLQATVPLGTPPGAYQIRVLGLSATNQPLGTSSDAITLIIQ